MFYLCLGGRFVLLNSVGPAVEIRGGLFADQRFAGLVLALQQSATLHIPGRDPLSLVGNEQITIFERLVVAWNSGSPDKQVKELMAGFSSRSPQQAFRPQMWDSIRGVYIGKGVKNGYWRLVFAERPTEDATQTLIEETV